MCTRETRTCAYKVAPGFRTEHTLAEILDTSIQISKKNRCRGPEVFWRFAPEIFLDPSKRDFRFR